MGVDIWDAEGAQRAIYDEAGAPFDEPCEAHELALALMGRGWCEYVDTLICDGCYSRAGARERIYLRRRMHPFREVWTIYHELSERHFYGERGDPAHDFACDATAARLRAPMAAFRRLVHAVGDDFATLASETETSQTSAAMRWAEVTGTPLIVVSPDHVRARGDAFEWPDEEELRRLSRARNLPDEIERVRLTDARGRVVIRAR